MATETLREIPRHGSDSPWGTIERLDVIIPDEFLFASTSSHGGYWLSARLMALLPECARSTRFSHGGWFEEDCDAAIPPAFIPECAKACRPGAAGLARETILNPHTDYWENSGIKAALVKVLDAIPDPEWDPAGDREWLEAQLPS
jgi:hypothetical protein